MNNLADIIRRGIKDQGYGYTLKGSRLTVSSDHTFAIDLDQLAEFITRENIPQAQVMGLEEAVLAERQRCFQIAKDFEAQNLSNMNSFKGITRGLFESVAAEARKIAEAITAKDLPISRVKALVWEAHGEGFRGCGPIIYDIYPATEGGGWWAALSMAGYLPYRERLASPEAAKEAAQRDFEHRILDGFDNPTPAARA